MEKIGIKIFAPYLTSNSIRPVFEKPFRYDGYICASDTYRLIRVREDLLREYPFNHEGKLPDMLKLVPEPNCNLTLTREMIRQALRALPTEDEIKLVSPEIPCRECDGDGEVYWTYEDKTGKLHRHCDDCPCCDGSGVYREAVYKSTGKKIVTQLAFVMLNGYPIPGRNFQILLETMNCLGIEEVTIMALNTGGHCLFRIADGIDFICVSLNISTGLPGNYHLNIEPNL